jgi:hippurate hydrolase
MPIKNRLAEMHSEITGWRRHLHENPELQFDVHETAAFVKEKLHTFGVDEVTPGVGQTGVVGVIKGKSDTSGRVIGLRADMDALPILEATGLDYASKVPGKMHACGHDGHTAMLLGAAKYLAETRNFDGTVVLIFQPAEEGGGGGREMVKDGLMERWNIQEVYGMHNAPGKPVGEFFIRPGALMASADEFFVTVTGRGGHAAAPHQAIDPNLAAAHVLIALQSIASRNVDPLAHIVVSVCSLHSDTEATNVIPQSVRMGGTVRALDELVRLEVRDRIHQIASATAEAYGCTATVEHENGYPVTVNADENTEYAADVARAVVGKVVDDTPPIMAAEDFSFMLNERPGAYIFLGNGDGAMVHHPEYNFNDEAIPTGCSWFAEMVETRMPAS